MEEIQIISDCYRRCYGHSETKIVALPRSGSDRRYFRVFSKDSTVIGAYNENREENDAFVGFTGHFFKKHLPVPEVFFYLP